MASGKRSATGWRERPRPADRLKPLNEKGGPDARLSQMG